MWYEIKIKDKVSNRGQNFYCDKKETKATRSAIPRERPPIRQRERASRMGVDKFDYLIFLYLTSLIMIAQYVVLFFYPYSKRELCSRKRTV